MASPTDLSPSSSPEKPQKYNWNYANPQLAKSVREEYRRKLPQYAEGQISAEPPTDEEIEIAAMEDAMKAMNLTGKGSQFATPAEYLKSDRTPQVVEEIVRARLSRAKKAEFRADVDKSLAQLSEAEWTWKYADAKKAGEIRALAARVFPMLNPPPTDKEVEMSAYDMYGAIGAPFREDPGGMAELWKKPEFHMALIANVLQKRLAQ